ncbi:hypothetical protein PFICI_02064 [Pestalotiopsis fici W106-1]|uniref:Uncharacterized protein n=1 Tax=Pestalotiopsis fici (strain W106-1 / CGMCC3.15140) TaxID=1229662 RepID=W3XSR2_PESFW|nr:uncharacterized protein PFICI_02064 [Pestalotiopsis fici W106-1]ETS88236.1 hypothetical protein PFICI_02064 [Pestalotiopsis fici W106-1]
MENEPCRIPRRSQSHGTLRTNYSRHARPAHKPLGRVNENSALLSSSAALGGMLKTTTETGDIGLYSINSVPSTAFGLASASRGSAMRRYPPPPHRRPPRSSIDGSSRPESYKRIHPSNRDTTSEIISMYGSNSQSSVTSTRATSSDEHGQRSQSMTTVGSRHLSHNKSNATLQSQASSGPLQRPRSPFPYPTRLRRPGARPVSPAVTEAGIVDYSRMVEIDRISLRTGYGPLKSTYPHAHHRPPLGVRPEANLSTPSLHSHRPPPMRRPPGTPSLRTISAASVASWAASNSNFPSRVDSYSSRTSSLTSVVNMYYRMPPALKAAHLGSLAPPPRYYDYTEEFETKQIPAEPPIERVASVTTRAPTAVQCPLPLVLREGSEEELANIFGSQIDSAFGEDDSQPDESQAETEPHLLSDVQFEDLVANDQTAPQAQPTPDTSGQNEGLICRPALGPEKMSRGSDIDLLPSQIGRSSVDTFRPSLDIESKGAQIFDYPKLRQSVSQQTNTPSPARQVQVHGGKTPTIKSEQGVIFRDYPDEGLATHDECRQDCIDATQEVEDAHMDPLRGPSRWLSRSDAALEHPNPTCDEREHFQDPRRCFAITDPANLDCPSATKIIMPKGSSERSESSSTPSKDPTLFNRILSASPSEHAIIIESQPRSESAQDMPLESRSNNRRQRVNLRLELNMDFPSQEDLTTPQLTPSCSLTPLTAPKPISPVRELRLKNSIPHLMKALPPLPGDHGYVSPSPSTVLDDEDEYTQILTPYVSLDDRNAVRKPRLSFSLRKPLPDIQKKLPRIRLKSKGPGSVHMHTNRESRPWNSDSNYPWCNDSPVIELGGTPIGECHHTSLGRRLKLKVPQDSPASTVRRHPEAHRSEPIEWIPYEQPQDLFSFSNAIGSAFRQAGRKISQGSTQTSILKKNRNVSSPLVQDRSDQKSAVTSSGNTSTLKRRKERTNLARRPIVDRGLSTEQHRGLRKRVSNLKWLLTRDVDVKTYHQATEETKLLHSERQDDLNRTTGLNTLKVSGDNVRSSQPRINFGDEKPRFRRRVKAKISKWMRGTRVALVQVRRSTRMEPAL